MKCKKSFKLAYRGGLIHHWKDYWTVQRPMAIYKLITTRARVMTPAIPTVTGTYRNAELESVESLLEVSEESALEVPVLEVDLVPVVESSSDESVGVEVPVSSTLSAL